MPLYEYQCRRCGKVFEMLLRIKDADKDLDCPNVTPTRLSASFPPSLPGAVARPVRAALPERDSPRSVGRKIKIQSTTGSPLLRLGFRGSSRGWLHRAHAATNSHAAHHHSASLAFGLGVFHMFQHLVVVVHHGLPHVNIRLPTCLLIGVANGGNVGLHLVKSGMHFLHICFHGLDVFLAHRLHVLMPLRPLARPYAGCWRLRSPLRPA